MVLARISPVLRRRRSLLWWGMAGFFFVAYTALAISRQQNLLTDGYDLGIFDEAVRSYAGGHLPYAALKGSAHYSVLGDHFSPVLVLLVPFYWILPTADTLLVAQAFLLAVALVPLARWAHRELGAEAAVVIAFGYGSSWGIAAAVGFDFHEVCFAVPLIAFSLEALAAERWRTALLWALPLVLVKEDLGFTLAAIGLLVAWKGPRLLGLAAAAFGVAASLVEVLVLIPLSSDSGYAYFAKSLGAGGAGAAAAGGAAVHQGLVHQLLSVPHNLILPHVKLVTLIALFAPTAFLALRSRLALVVVPTLLWRFLSDTPAYWGMTFHYSADLMPVVFAAFVDALAQCRRQGWSPRRLRAVLAVSLAVSAVLIPDHPLGALSRPKTYAVSPVAEAGRELAGRIPNGATVAADNDLAAQLTDRATVFLFPSYPNPGLPTAQYIITNPASPVGWPDRSVLYRADVAQALAHGYHQIASDDGFVLLRRDSTG